MNPQQAASVIQPTGNVSFYTQCDMVRHFTRAFGRTEKSLIENLTEEEIKLRKDLVIEELGEFVLAIDRVTVAQSLENKAELLDAIIDSIYVLMGTAIAFGLPFDFAFDMVHHANMSKLGPDGAPILREDGKVLKPEGWQPAKLNELLMAVHKQLSMRDKHQLTGAKSPIQVVESSSQR